jgi:Ulp1 family protease
VFNKKFIFVPVNGDLHWSLCVIVNPGRILDVIHDAGNVSDTEEDEEKEWPW